MAQNYDKVSSIIPGDGQKVSKYDDYAKIDDKPQANYFVLPSAQKLYEAAFGAGATLPVEDEAAKKKAKKMCHRCEKVKAQAKVTIGDTALKLCSPCAETVQTNPAIAHEMVMKMKGAAPAGPCEKCKERPQHVRANINGQVLTVCTKCMAESPFYAQLTRFAIACVAKQKIAEAKTAFEELLLLSPEHPAILYNCACVEALARAPDKALMLLERALAAGYSNFKGMKKDSDLKQVRKLPGYQPMVDKYAGQAKKEKKGLFKRTVSKNDATKPEAPPPAAKPSSGPPATPSSGPPPTTMREEKPSAKYGENYSSLDAVRPDYGKVSYDASMPINPGSTLPGVTCGGPPIPSARKPINSGPPTPSKPVAYESASLARPEKVTYDAELPRAAVEYESSLPVIAAGAAGARGPPPATPSRGPPPATPGRGPPPATPSRGPAVKPGPSATETADRLDAEAAKNESEFPTTAGFDTIMGSLQDQVNELGLEQLSDSEDDPQPPTEADNTANASTPDASNAKPIVNQQYSDIPVPPGAAAELAKAKAPADELPAGWKKFLDKNTGRHYYHCKATKETIWTKPKPEQAVPEAAAAGGGAPAPATTSTPAAVESATPGPATTTPATAAAAAAPTPVTKPAGGLPQPDSLATSPKRALPKPRGPPTAAPARRAPPGAARRPMPTPARRGPGRAPPGRTPVGRAGAPGSPKPGRALPTPARRRPLATPPARRGAPISKPRNPLPVPTPARRGPPAPARRMPATPARRGAPPAAARRAPMPAARRTMPTPPGRSMPAPVRTMPPADDLDMEPLSDSDDGTPGLSAPTMMPPAMGTAGDSVVLEPLSDDDSDDDWD